MSRTEAGTDFGGVRTGSEYVPIRVTVNAPHDDDATDKEVTLTHRPIPLGNNGYNSVLKDFVITIMDDDTAGFTFNPSMLTVGEGTTIVYTLVLNTQPINEVTIAISSDGDTSDGDVSVQPPTLDFTTSNWNNPQQVMVSAPQDDDGVPGSATLSHTVTTVGGDYGSVTADLAVTIIDDDIAGIILNPTMLTVDEEKTVDAYTVVLNTQPTAAVSITISDDSNISVQSPTPLTFTRDNWDTQQTVTVNAARDDNAVDDSATLTHTATGGDYEGLTADLAVTIIDSADIILGNVMTNNTLVIQESHRHNLHRGTR